MPIIKAIAALYKDSNIFSKEHLRKKNLVCTQALQIARYCRAAKRDTKKQQIAKIYNMLYLSLQQLVVKPKFTITLDNFLTYLEKKAAAYRQAFNFRTTLLSINKRLLASNQQLVLIFITALNNSILTPRHIYVL